MTDELAQQTTESSGPAVGGGATVAPEAIRTTATEPDLTDPSLYFNRELSWLDFNDRVLQLAEDPRIPLLERVNFCAIYEDNLDEFFMVRVAGLHEKVESKIDARGADALAPADVIDLIRQRTIELRKRLTRCFDADLNFMYRLRRVFDPDGLMNPAKLLPSHPACGEGFRPTRPRLPDGAWV